MKGYCARGLRRHELTLAAVGAGAGYVLRRLHLLAAAAAAAVRFIREIIDRAGGISAPAVIGSMQGSIPPGVGREAARKTAGRDPGRTGGKGGEDTEPRCSWNR